MANIKVKDLSNTSSVNTTDKMMILTNENTNQVQNVTIQNLLTSAISSDANNVLEQGNDYKLYVETPENITGKLTNLTTTNKSTLVGAINEVDGDVGNLANLNSSVKTSVVNAINSVISDENTKVGSLENLTTSDKTSIVNAINSAVSDYDNKIGDLGDLDTTDKTDVVAAINELAAIAEPSLQYETMNNSKALETGAPSENPIILADIQKYAHSTFDRSKFTVVGSPNITDDGIASGFSSGNYITINNLDLANKPFVWKCKANFEQISSTDFQIIMGDGTKILGLYQGSSNFLQLVAQNVGGSYVYGTSTGVISDFTTKECDITINVNNDGANATIICNGYTYTTTLTFENLLFTQNATVTICRYKYNIRSIDLKQFSITVDGKEVFSGNKTGIDTIKANNFTDSGSLVNAEGIAVFPTTHNTSSIVLPEQFKPADKPWEIYIHCKTGESWNTAPTLFSATASNDNYASIALTIGTNHEAFILNLNLDDNQTGFTNNIGTNFAPVLNTEYWLKLAFTGSDYQIFVSSDGGKTYTLNAHLSSTTPFAQNQTAPSCIGIGRAASSAQQWGGSIDLNAFKVYVDGDLSYQPCLKIPYTEAHSGAKIVDSIYRNRVTDAYNQGYVDYHYYTLSDTDFTLPMGDIFGMIENKFDTVTATSDERQAIIGYLMPDYANGISFSGNSSYTCPSYGVVICVGSTSSGYRRVLCNGEMVGSYSQTGDVTSSCYFPVKQGDVITNEQNTTFFGNTKFYPLKGV